ncbi:hypothetical protein OROMI_027057 [Orobanche minor]
MVEINYPAEYITWISGHEHWRLLQQLRFIFNHIWHEHWQIRSVWPVHGGRHRILFPAGQR